MNSFTQLAFICLLSLIGDWSILHVQSIHVVILGVDNTTPTSCNGSVSADSHNYQSGVCLATSSTSSNIFTCGADGSQSFTRYSDSTCTSPFVSGNLTATSINKCMPVYYMNNALAESVILACDGSGDTVTSDPHTQPVYSDTLPLTNDTYVTNVQYWSNANCSGTPLTSYANFTNGACITNLTPQDPGAGIRLSCMNDPSFYGKIQFAEVWVGQPISGQPTSTTCAPHGDIQGWTGFVAPKFGGCMTLYLASKPYGSYKFICPSFMTAAPSSSSSGMSSSSSSMSGVSSSGPSSSAAASSTASSSVSSSSTGPTNPMSSSSSTGGTASSGSIGMDYLMMSPWMIVALMIVHFVAIGSHSPI